MPENRKLACGMNGIRIERVFLEGGSPLIVDRAGPLGLSAVYWPRSHRACSVVIHWGSEDGKRNYEVSRICQFIRV